MEDKQKQHLIDMMRADEELGLYVEPFKHKVEEILANRSNAYEFIDFDKQETLEEAAEIYSERHQDVSGTLGRYLVGAVFKDGAKWQKEQFTIEEQHIGHSIDELDKSYIKGFNEGSAYQQERMYSEEDMEKAIKFGADGMYGWQMGEEGYYVNQVKRFLETFKKK
jgi:glutaredoxin